jgi:hypothetical protein
MSEHKTIYNFHVETTNYPEDRMFPKESQVTVSFDGTDAHIDMVVDQFTTFLRAAGYPVVSLMVLKS